MCLRLATFLVELVCSNTSKRLTNIYATNARTRAFMGARGGASACTRELTCRLARNVATAPNMYFMFKVWPKTQREEPHSLRLFVMILVTRTEHLPGKDTANP